MTGRGVKKSRGSKGARSSKTTRRITRGKKKSPKLLFKGGRQL